ncbi:drug/metabolite transporter (DMT)-like permease [Allocatelliglobosispora scoriae]|uniref:Drug/metabolite transporter (DMT)-like permease n=1 Tax=Allocatelliglobosispora scoriae TaxID=643052 RepID=A0A841BPW6_9ACTN|nr:EamA family transporter [Allocatelliglobosispora scoriae]MBB5869408.1 drug/metabolite transporter (DMT)-like permease [Allocatelliglobosispora scoriae]
MTTFTAGRTPARPGLGVAMVLLAGLFFAVNGTVSKLILQSGIAAQQLTLVRATGAFAGLLLLMVFLPGSTKPRLRIQRRELPLIVAYGLTGFFLVPMLYFVSITRMPVGIALLFEYTAPLFVALWARFGQGSPVRPRLWGGLALCLLGLACVAEIWGDLRLDPIGVAAGLACAVLLAVYFVLGERGVQGRDTISLTGWAFGVSALAGLVVRLIVAGPGGWEPLAGTTADGVPILLLAGYMVLFGSIAAYLLIVGAMRHLPATSVGIIGMIEPVIASAVAWIAIGEHLNPAQLAGGALLLVGVGLAETARITQPPPAPITHEPAPAHAPVPM